MVLFTLYFSVKADLNPGIATSIWSVVPFYMSVADYFAFGVKLKRNHIVGITLIMLTVILVGLRDVINPKEVKIGEISTAAPEPTVSIIVPVIFGLIAPISFTVSAIFGKHLAC